MIRKTLTATIVALALIASTAGVAQAQQTPIDSVVDCDDSFWTLAPACNPAPLNLDGPIEPYSASPLASLIDCKADAAFFHIACGLPAPQPAPAPLPPVGPVVEVIQLAHDLFCVTVDGVITICSDFMFT